MKNSIKVSVSIITYNHEKYIAQSIESVLSQKTNFPFEIIIGEDGSSDKTPEICKKYQQKYPDKIRLFLNDRSNVIYVDGAPTGKWNLNNNIENAQGEYVALLEGDDYWQDDAKLQQQVDLMEANQDWSMCFHDIEIVHSDGSPTGIEKLPAGMKKTLDRETLIAGYFPTPPTGSILYRRKFLATFPDWFYKFKNGDIAISVILSGHGNAGYIDKKMSAYRQHTGGIWSTKNMIHKAKVTLIMRTMLLEMFAPIGAENNERLIIDNHLLILKKSLISFNLKLFLTHFFKLISFSVKANRRLSYFLKRLIGRR